MVFLGWRFLRADLLPASAGSQTDTPHLLFKAGEIYTWGDLLLMPAFKYLSHRKTTSASRAAAPATLCLKARF
jgi:hypothetical protein